MMRGEEREVEVRGDGCAVAVAGDCGRDLAATASSIWDVC